MKSSFIISLDFELMWGVLDNTTPDKYGKTNIDGVYESIPRMIALFNKYNIKATFATVGLLMLHDKEQAQEIIPQITPTYDDMRLSPYCNNYIGKIEEEYNHQYFAPSLLSLIKGCDNVEIGTHTFCHYYCNAKGQKIEQFEADIKKAIEIAEKMGISLKSIVFPRNQVSKEYLGVCAKHGIESYRGNPDKYFTKPNSKREAMKNRLGRMVDAYINLGGHTSYSPNTIDTRETPLNIKASRFFRPYMKKLSFLEPLRVKRIKKEMMYAAKHEEIYHLWWHPHNFGADIEQNMKNLEDILICYQWCHENYGMESHTMYEMKRIIKGE